MFITLINDCSDDNAKARQTTRWSVLFSGINVSFVGVNSSLGTSSTIEAAGNLVDILDASDGSRGIVAVNVAPRGQIELDGKNGSRFCYFYHKDTLVLSTIKGYNLSLVKKFELTKFINVFETSDVLEFAKKKGLIDQDLENYIGDSQFRSLDFQPRVARWLTEKMDLPSQKISVNELPDIPPTIWYIDSFGNIKTTLTTKDLRLKVKNEADKIIKTNIGSFKLYSKLKDLPDGQTAAYVGSSGIGKEKFVEIATQNRSESARSKLKAKVGDIISINVE